MRLFLSLVWKDLQDDWRGDLRLLFTPAFLLLLITTFPLALGPAPEVLARLAPGLVCLCVLIAALSGLDRLFVRDYESGFLETVHLSGTPLWVYMLAALAAHLILAGAPVIILTPMIGLMLGTTDMTFLLLCPLVAGLLFSAIALVGGMLRALTLSARENRFLTGIIAIPLLLPPLIFAAGALSLAALGLSPVQPLLCLAAFALAFAVASPYVGAHLLRWSLLA